MATSSQVDQEEGTPTRALVVALEPRPESSLQLPDLKLTGGTAEQHETMEPAGGSTQRANQASQANTKNESPQHRKQTFSGEGNGYALRTFFKKKKKKKAAAVSDSQSPEPRGIH
eukprot:FR735880.1.p2 GENE.FR735880.1~~FR735880.1.p2  ORF type:complete len:115 (+),score=36.09 FR735880.1:471-815(+)